MGSKYPLVSFSGDDANHAHGCIKCISIAQSIIASCTVQLEGAITSTEKHISAQNQEQAALKVRFLSANQQPCGEDRDKAARAPKSMMN